MINHRWMVASITALSMVALGGCASNTSSASKTSQSTPTATSASDNARADSSTNSTKPIIYASTDVWASVARQVAGDNATVTTSIDNPAQDPHDYEATVKDKQAVNQAKIAVINGGGYDDWAKKLVESAPNKPILLDAVKISGLDGGKAEGEFNEHVFYSLPTAKKVAAQIADQLAKLDASKADTFKNNESNFVQQVDSLMKKAAQYAKPDIHSVATEPVVGYLLEEMHIKDITPDEFVEQSETEAGPSVKLQDETIHLLTDHKAQILVLNAQTEDPVSDRLAKAAEGVKTPIVKVYETFPSGVNDYVTWIKNAIDSLGTAVSQVAQ